MEHDLALRVLVLLHRQLLRADALADGARRHVAAPQQQLVAVDEALQDGRLVAPDQLAVLEHEQVQHARHLGVVVRHRHRQHHVRHHRVAERAAQVDVAREHVVENFQRSEAQRQVPREDLGELEQVPRHRGRIAHHLLEELVRRREDLLHPRLDAARHGVAARRVHEHAAAHLRDREMRAQVLHDRVALRIAAHALLAGGGIHRGDRDDGLGQPVDVVDDHLLVRGHEHAVLQRGELAHRRRHRLVELDGLGRLQDLHLAQLHEHAAVRIQQPHQQRDGLDHERLVLVLRDVREHVDELDHELELVRLLRLPGDERQHRAAEARHRPEARSRHVRQRAEALLEHVALRLLASRLALVDELHALLVHVRVRPQVQQRRRVRDLLGPAERQDELRRRHRAGVRREHLEDFDDRLLADHQLVVVLVVAVPVVLTVLALVRLVDDGRRVVAAVEHGGQDVEPLQHFAHRHKPQPHHRLERANARRHAQVQRPVVGVEGRVRRKEGLEEGLEVLHHGGRDAHLRCGVEDALLGLAAFGQALPHAHQVERRVRLVAERRDVDLNGDQQVDERRSQVPGQALVADGREDHVGLVQLLDQLHVVLVPARAQRRQEVQLPQQHVRRRSAADELGSDAAGVRRVHGEGGAGSGARRVLVERLAGREVLQRRAEQVRLVVRVTELVLRHRLAEEPPPEVHAHHVVLEPQPEEHGDVVRRRGLRLAVSGSGGIGCVGGCGGLLGAAAEDGFLLVLHDGGLQELLADAVLEVHDADALAAAQQRQHVHVVARAPPVLLRQLHEALHQALVLHPHERGVVDEELREGLEAAEVLLHEDEEAPDVRLHRRRQPRVLQRAKPDHAERVPGQDLQLDELERHGCRRALLLLRRPLLRLLAGAELLLDGVDAVDVAEVDEGLVAEDSLHEFQAQQRHVLVDEPVLRLGQRRALPQQDVVLAAGRAQPAQRREVLAHLRHDLRGRDAVQQPEVVVAQRRHQAADRGEHPEDEVEVLELRSRHLDELDAVLVRGLLRHGGPLAAAPVVAAEAVGQRPEGHGRVAPLQPAARALLARRDVRVAQPAPVALREHHEHAAVAARRVAGVVRRLVEVEHRRVALRLDQHHLVVAVDALRVRHFLVVVVVAAGGCGRRVLAREGARGLARALAGHRDGLHRARPGAEVPARRERLEAEAPLRPERHRPARERVVRLHHEHRVRVQALLRHHPVRHVLQEHFVCRLVLGSVVRPRRLVHPDDRYVRDGSGSLGLVRGHEEGSLLALQQLDAVAAPQLAALALRRVGVVDLDLEARRRLAGVDLMVVVRRAVVRVRHVEHGVARKGLQHDHVLVADLLALRPHLVARHDAPPRSAELVAREVREDHLLVRLLARRAQAPALHEEAVRRHVQKPHDLSELDLLAQPLLRDVQRHFSVARHELEHGVFEAQRARRLLRADAERQHQVVRRHDEPGVGRAGLGFRVEEDLVAVTKDRRRHIWGGGGGLR